MFNVKLFALLKDKAGTGEIAVSGEHATVGDLLHDVARRYPALADLIAGGRFLVTVNRELAKVDSRVRDGDEVGLMPPFSGGEDEGARVRVQHGPFSLEEEVARIKKASRSIGAVVTFVGTTRDVSRGKEVSKLDFEHYAGMAEKKLAEIRERAIREFGVIEIGIVHRVGTLPVGEDIVLIAVAAAHRDEAFRACRFCIDELKRIVPIWKRETTPDGEVWVEEHP